MTQRGMAFLLELVADVFEHAEATGDPGYVVSELRSKAGVLKAARVPHGFVWCEKFGDGPCEYHPLGGPDCAL